MVMTVSCRIRQQMRETDGYGQERIWVKLTFQMIGSLQLLRQLKLGVMKNAKRRRGSIRARESSGKELLRPAEWCQKVLRQFNDKGSKAAAGVKDDSCKGVDPLQSILVRTLKASRAGRAEKPLSASASAKVAKPQGTLSAADKQQGENVGLLEGTSDVKKDKRQWALEILARKYFFVHCEDRRRRFRLQR
ncbi:hypothetical protein R1sor_018920 [Riccia sorocarpa]|uniref:Uncharacterized protein n=1 Tax=Riccia sorocarpa TaxID=122646 RepID=A0ABD3IB31_9MARC